MRIGIGAGAYTRYGISEGARKAREHGYDCFDFGGFVNTETDFFKQDEESFKEELLRYKELVEAEKIVVWQAHSPWRYPARDSTEEERAERLESFLKAVRGAGYLGATHFVLHAIMPFGTNSPDHPELMRDMNAAFMSFRFSHTASAFHLFSILYQSFVCQSRETSVAAMTQQIFF